MRRIFYSAALFLAAAFCAALFLTRGFLSAEDEKVGVRPYEMDWAGRTAEVRPPLVDFESFGDWKIETVNAVASFTQSRAEQMYGQYVGKLVYRRASADDKADPVVTLRRVEPIPLPADFDTASLWIEGNNWAWAVDPKTPQAAVALIFQAADGAEVSLAVERVRWNEWFLCYIRVPDGIKKQLAKPGALFCGFRITGGRNLEDRDLYFDSLCLFKEELSPLEFSRRPKRGIEMFPGQPCGQNTGEGRLPFPTRPETILPSNRTANFKNRVDENNGAFEFFYEGEDGKLVYTYRPEKGDWSDLTASWNGGAPFYPLFGGGVTSLAAPDAPNSTKEPVKTFALESVEKQGETVVVRWRLKSERFETVVEYHFGLLGKNLVLDTFASGGYVPEIPFGRIEKIDAPRNVLIPYYTYGYTARPAAALFDYAAPDGKKTPLFALGNIDWYRSNASSLRGTHSTGADSAVFSGGAEYIPVWRGKRNDVFERYFITVSPTFEEILPTIDNPVSPWKSVTGKGVWRAHGASNRENDKKHWRNVWRHGMRHVIVTDHETCWRDGGESFTFRTRPAPQKGGDEGWIDYSRYMQETLGFVYGPYNNFTDFAPVNEYWSPDMVSRTPDGRLQEAWARCYAPKPSRAVEYCEKLSPINEAKFHFSTAYCDVHSSVTPWSRTDYDPRTPGAGTFAAVYYPYGEIMLLQKAAWDGPVYSEGPHHCFYSGLTDGNYAQDQAYCFMSRPWLVDFDLLKMHPLECDFGMGNISMFAPGYAPKDAREREALLDRFITATVAFGHPGFLALEYGIEGGMRSYFMVQQIASRYTASDAESIRYADADGKLYETSGAIASDVYARSQLVVRYQDGTTVVANGSPTERMNVELDGKKFDLPPNGFEAFTRDGAIHSVASDEEGNRYDYSESPEYIFINGRNHCRRLPKAFGTGLGVCLIGSDGASEIIPLGGARLGFALEAAEAVALDVDGNELGPAKLTRSRGYVFVEPVEGAFSYRLKNGSAPDSAEIPAELDSERYRAAAGETIAVFDRNDPAAKFEVTVPADAKVGTLWTAEPKPGAKIDFEIVPLAELTNAAISKETAEFQFDSALPNVKELCVEFRRGEKSERKTVPMEAGRARASFDLGAPEKEGSEKIALTISSGNLSEIFEKNLVVRSDYLAYPADFGDRFDSKPDAYAAWVEVREKERSQDFASSFAQLAKSGGLVCGGEKKVGVETHPPYRTGPGRVYMEYSLAVPAAESVVLAASVGKRDGSDKGDGIWYRAAVVDGAEEKTLGETAVTEFGWRPFEADLSAYAGKTVLLRLITDCGPSNDTSADWGAWSEIRLRSAEKVLGYVIE